MLSDFISLFLSIFGSVAILFYCIFKLILWKIESIEIAVPLRKSDKDIYEKISNIYSLLSFCGLNKKCTIALINYDAPIWFCNEIADYFKSYNFLKIIDSGDNASKIFH